ncbi:hypothetical protein B0H16DRAFT_1743590 [Mycena metata]|uniref:Uncharacterized protein n=1 Tax=Mycena metata TaxID=1033252 RepID=A0AAD7H5V8_9AGAR|nr:hypothetical protein B0H16DRAFT_1743590 [Mycena metata]
MDLGIGMGIDTTDFGLFDPFQFNLEAPSLPSSRVPERWQHQLLLPPAHLTPLVREGTGLPKAVHQLRRVVATASTEFTALPATLPAVLIVCRRCRRRRRLRPQRHCHHGCALPSNRLPHHIAHQHHVPHITPPLPHITPTPLPAVPTPDLEFLNYYFFSIFSFDVLS